MQSKPPEKAKGKIVHSPCRDWNQMNRQQRRHMMRKIQSDDLSLEVVHPDAAGIACCALDGLQANIDTAIIKTVQFIIPTRSLLVTTGNQKKWTSVPNSLRLPSHGEARSVRG